ncbi:DUF1616 domain-containing protein [Methanolobus profundi]|uniref:Uncharacterized membrane protein n=1 Tax=Methanolobus profundi TaxID=487685 RepID=A0A1I4RXU8_9EURY|nr:DUF1616 domain-containing protein [Methanolobus profundi]SFM57058.1 Uncharacterized membrane protein [Methanolobus profundi]
MLSPNKCKYTTDLKVLIIVSLLSAIFILIAPFNETPLRILFALLLIFFTPGYAFIATIFPGSREISVIERFTLSVGFSIIIMVFDGFLISLTEWKFRPNSITISLILLTLVFILLAYLSRKRLPEDDQFSFSFQQFISDQESDSECTGPDNEENECQEELTGKRQFAARNRKKVSAVNKSMKEITASGPQRSDILSPQITKTLMIAMVLSIIVAGSMFAYAKATREKETFSTLYILGPDGKAEDYPTNFSTSDPIHVIAGVENYEHESANYTLNIDLDGTTIDTIQFTLDHGNKWEEELTISPTRSKQGRQKFELVLYRGEPTGTTYRSVHLWLDQVVSTETIETEKYDVIDFATIDNPSMEIDTGWEFSSTNESIATGYYMNGSGIYASQAYVINSSYEGITERQLTTHTIQQVIESDREADVLLSCYIKDTYTGGTSNKDEYQFKRVLFNGQLVWYDGVNGDEGWQHIQVPVSIKEGDNTLSFMLLQSALQSISPVEVMIDEVSFLPESALSPYIEEDNTVEFNLPESNVYPLPISSDEIFTVEWNGTDKGSGIFYYNIQYSTDGTTWNDWFKRTSITSAEFKGTPGVTYYFRSIATDNALNREIIDTVADTKTSVDISLPTVELDITPNPTSDVTYLTVEANKALLKVECTITPRNFGGAETIELTTSDNITWTSKYTIEVQDTYDIEVIATDHANNEAYTFGTLYTDETLEELLIEIEPEKVSDEATITITSSTALKDEPTVIVKDRYGYKLEVKYDSSDENEYVYTVTTDDDDLDYTIRDGTARVTVTAKTADSMTLYEEETFLIDRVDPTIESLTPDKGETIGSDTVSIRASYSDNRAGIDKTKVTLQINGVDVTDNSEVDYGSISYTATGLEDGEVEVRLVITDQAGNTQEENWSFYVST